VFTFEDFQNSRQRADDISHHIEVIARPGGNDVVSGFLYCDNSFYIEEINPHQDECNFIGNLLSTIKDLGAYGDIEIIEEKLRNRHSQLKRSIKYNVTLDRGEYVFDALEKAEAFIWDSFAEEECHAFLGEDS
jgi:hypothetical protein